MLNRPRAALSQALENPSDLAARFREVRTLSERLTMPLSDADATVQAMDDASPAKWHLAHTTWFFETFVLRDHVSGYRLYDARWPYLFNSYYDAEGDRHPRPRRGMLTRPSLAEILTWRRHVDDAVERALQTLSARARRLILLGCQHEQQHQELIQTDLLALFALNPLAPALWPGPRDPPAPPPAAIRWVEGAEGRVEIGSDDAQDEDGGFAFDCEGPRHPVLLRRHALADRPVSNSEWRSFIDDGGYERPEHWLSDGWAWVKANGIGAPAYWRRATNGWAVFGMDGLHPLPPAAPVAHISYYEADAFARWAGARLPTEAEWESAAQAFDSLGGNQLDEAGPVRPRSAGDRDGLRQMFGDVWEWTASAYLPYPGFRPAPGAIGEYNGKFMSGQFVLRGGSCATPRGHARASYRNFFYPHQRWQFTGLRLARDL